jgi:recombination protein RecA
MSERIRLQQDRLKESEISETTDLTNYSLYFASEKTHLEFIPTGCTKLDCVLGGGWVLGRQTNIVGPRSVGKTLLAIEAAANFAIKYPKGKIFYRESEAAFDEEYARALGMPLNRVSFIEEDQTFFTVEDFYNDLLIQIDLINKLQVPGLYILDSLDALSDEAELGREFGEASFGANKAKRMGELFRKLTQKISTSNMSLIIISQERDNLGVTFGKKVTRSGGRAIDFYLTHLIWLSQIETLHKEKTYNGKKVKRAVGIKVKARCEKNKISLPFRECTFDIIFGTGIDDFTSNMDWLEEVGRTNDLDLEGRTVSQYYKQVNKMDDEHYWQEVRKVSAATKLVWQQIEQDFLSLVPTRRKYS